MPDRSSKARFVDAAAREFIDSGYEGTTIRAIAARAGTSIASLSRNWTGKKHLFEDVFALHFGIVHQAQASNLDALESRGVPELEEMLYAFYHPVLARGAVAGGGTPSHRVYCKALSDPSDEVKQIIRPLLADMRARMIRLARTCLPGLDEQTLFLAMNVINGTYVYPQIHGSRLAAGMGLNEDMIDWDRATRTLAQMVAGGVAAFGGTQ